MVFTIKYNFKEYKDYPEATEISRERSRRQAYLSFTFVGFGFLSIAAAVAGIISGWSIADIITGVVAFVVFAALWVLLNKYYPRKTEKLIKEAIEKRDAYVVKQEQLMTQPNVTSLRVGHELKYGSHSVTPVASDAMIIFCASREQFIQGLYSKDYVWKKVHKKTEFEFNKPGFVVCINCVIGD